MISKAKLVLIAALTVTGLAATPAFSQSFDEDEGTGNVLQSAYQSAAPAPAIRHARTRATSRNGLNALAMEPPRLQSRRAPLIQTPFESDDPAITGGGSVGYNELLRQEP